MIIMSFVEMMVLVGTAQNIIIICCCCSISVNCSKFIEDFFGHYNTAAWDVIRIKHWHCVHLCGVVVRSLPWCWLLEMILFLLTDFPSFLWSFVLMFCRHTFLCCCFSFLSIVVYPAFHTRVNCCFPIMLFCSFNQYFNQASRQNFAEKC